MVIPFEESIEPYLISDLNVHLLVYINGIFNAELSSIGELQEGVIIDSFFNQIMTNTDFLKKNLFKSESLENSFNLLNSSFTYDGLVVFLPKNKVIEKQVNVLNIAVRNDDKPLIQDRKSVV